MKSHPAKRRNMHTRNMNTRGFSLVWVVILAILIVGVLYAVFFQKNPKFLAQMFPGNNVGTITPTPTPKPLICKGNYVFSVSGNSTQEPKIKSGTLNPCDPKQGVMQFLTVQFGSVAPVVSGTVVVSTDTKTQTVEMGKLEDGSWKASWRMEDAYSVIYSVAITGKTATSEKTTVLTFR